MPLHQSWQELHTQHGKCHDSLAAWQAHREDHLPAALTPELHRNGKQNVCCVCGLVLQKWLKFIQQGLQQALLAYATTYLALLVAPALPACLVPAALIPAGLPLPHRGHRLRQTPVGHQPIPARMGGSTWHMLGSDKCNGTTDDMGADRSR